jgi:dolichol-phosphate mannosyltransferase
VSSEPRAALRRSSHHSAPGMNNPSVAVVIPVYNEAEALPGFLEEIDRTLAPHVEDLRFVVIDDASNDSTPDVLEAMRSRLSATLDVHTNPHNRGHGPSLMEGYRRALALDPDFVLQVDGDGQFHGSDLRRVLVLLLDEARAVSGVRRYRQDPWFRMSMTRLVRYYIEWKFAVRARDANCPLRGYEAALLDDLLAVLPHDCSVPNLLLTVIASRRGVAQLEVDVSHRVRRGAEAEGTTWSGSGPRLPIPWRLLTFSMHAFRELRIFRDHMDEPAWARRGSLTSSAFAPAPDRSLTQPKVR